MTDAEAVEATDAATVAAMKRTPPGVYAQWKHALAVVVAARS